MKKIISIFGVLLLLVCSCTPAHEHTFNIDVWEYDTNYHWHPSSCNHDVTTEKINHEFENIVTPATFESEGYTTHTCKVCDYQYIDDITEVLSHNYSSEWSHNEIQHWHACIDVGYESLTLDLSNHIFEHWFVDEEPTCSVDGIEYSLCSVCNFRKEKSIPSKHVFENHICVICGEEQEYIKKLDVSVNGDKTLFAYIYDDIVCEGGYELYFEGSGAISGKFNLLQIQNYNITSIIYGEGVTTAYFYSSKPVYLKRFILSSSIEEMQVTGIMLECDLIFPSSLKRIISLSGYVEELNLPSTIERFEDGALTGLRFDKVTIDCLNAYFGKRVFGQAETTDYVSSNFSGETVSIGDLVYVVINEGDNYVLTHVSKNRKDTSLTSLIIEEKTMFWEAYSTYGCWYVTDVYLPSTLQYIGMMVFFEMYSLETIHYNGTLEEFSKIIKEDYSQYYNTHSRNGYSGDKIVDVICNDGSTTLTLYNGAFS